MTTTTFHIPAGETVTFAGPVTIENFDARGHIGTVSMEGRFPLYLTGVPGWRHEADIPAGCLPVGVVVQYDGQSFQIVNVGMTAYLLRAGARCEWVAFQDVHGRPAAASPLVVLG